MYTETKNTERDELLFCNLINEQRRICFVCSGNTCRSPMAAAVLNHYGEKYRMCAISAGLYPGVGDPINPLAVKALVNGGILPREGFDYNKHTAVHLTEGMLEDCDMVVGMTNAHVLALINAFPAQVQKTYAMPRDIIDPFGGGEEVYEKCLKEIIAGVKELFHLND